jgi:glycosyltransferase involved in cell wall biosynthesis
MKTHLLLIHQAFAAKDDPGGTRHYELGQRLAAHGATFTVIASDISYLTGDRLASRQEPLCNSPADGIRILRASTYSAFHASYASRLASFLSFMISSVVAGARAGKPDVVMGTTPPIFQAVSAWALSVMHRKPFLLEVRDLWPEFAIDIGLLKNSLLIRLARGLESFLYARADYLLVNSPAYRDYLIRKGIDPGKVSFIPNGVDPSMFDPRSHADEVREQYALEGKYVITYAGAIGMANDLDVLIDAAAAIRHRTDIQVLIVGDGKERKRLQDKTLNLGLTNVTFSGALPKSQMPRILAASDACIAILRNIKMFATTYPNKVFDYMAAGRPTVLAIDGVIREVLEAANGGIFVPPGDAKKLSEAIIHFADHREQAKEMGENARCYVENHFNRDDQANELMKLISRITSEREIA